MHLFELSRRGYGTSEQSEKSADKFFDNLFAEALCFEYTELDEKSKSLCVESLDQSLEGSYRTYIMKGTLKAHFLFDGRVLCHFGTSIDDLKREVERERTGKEDFCIKGMHVTTPMVIDFFMKRNLPPSNAKIQYENYQESPRYILTVHEDMVNDLVSYMSNIGYIMQNSWRIDEYEYQLFFSQKD